MSTMSEISALLDEIKSCSNTLISIYDELHNLIDSKEPDEEKPKTKTRKKRTKTEEAPETVLEEQPPEEPPKPLTFEEIQTAFGMKSRDGYTAEVKALITKFGAKKLSESDPTDYPALIKELEVTGNDRYTRYDFTIIKRKMVIIAAVCRSSGRH